MNAGVFSLIDSQPLGTRRFNGRLGFGGSSYPVTDQASSAIGAVGVVNNTVSGFSAGQRVLAYSMTGRGAARLFLIGVSTAQTMRYEVWVDGVRVLDLTRSSSVGVQPLVGLFSGSQATALQTSMDFIPFESSFEVFFTPGATNSVFYGLIMDAYQ